MRWEGKGREGKGREGKGREMRRLGNQGSNQGITGCKNAASG
jgi:hypothetical protein